MTSLRFRVVTVLVLGAAALWLPFAFLHVNGSALWLAMPFLGANILLATGLAVALVNNWHRSAPPAYTVPEGSEPAGGRDRAHRGRVAGHTSVTRSSPCSPGLARRAGS